MILNWFNTGEIDELARTIVDELVKRCPPDGKDLAPKKSAERLEKTLNSIFSRAGTFARSTKLNTYKIAHFGTEVKLALKEAGYPKEFVETFAIELLTTVTTQARKRP